MKSIALVATVALAAPAMAQIIEIPGGGTPRMQPWKVVPPLYDLIVAQRVRDVVELPEGVSPETSKLTVVLQVVVTPEGNFALAELTTPSGDAGFDGAVMAAAESFAAGGQNTVKAPTSEKIRGQALGEGLTLRIHAKKRATRVNAAPGEIKLAPQRLKKGLFKKTRRLNPK